MVSGFCYTETGCLFLCLHHIRVLDACDLFIAVGRAKAEVLTAKR